VRPSAARRWAKLNGAAYTASSCKLSGALSAQASANWSSISFAASASMTTRQRPAGSASRRCCQASAAAFSC
jgi:hypothetical protein